MLQGLAPIIDTTSQILILGSMPSVKSLQLQQYYAHPRNRFWPLLALLFNRSTPFIDYMDKQNFLLSHHLALWDSIDTCERHGSMDSSITQIHPNDIQHLLQQYPLITTICCNGSKSSQVFKQYHANNLSTANLNIYDLPSTSPANAKYSLTDLARYWGPALLHNKKG